MTGGITARGAVLLGLLVAGFVPFACGGADAGPEAVPWAVATGVVGASTGSYSKEMAFDVQGKRRVALREWVSYDLDRKLIDRRIGLADDPSTARVEEAATRDDPSLRFIYTPRRVLMWNLNARGRCGTPWVEMPGEVIRQVTGYRLSDLLLIQPAEVLRTARGKPLVVTNNERATVYQVPVSVGASLPGTSFLAARPNLADSLRKRTVDALVRVRRTGPITISVDLTEPLRAALGPIPGLDVEWTVERSAPKLDAKLPQRVADSSCLSGG